MTVPRRLVLRSLWSQQPGLYRGFAVDVATAAILGTLLVVGGRQRATARAWVVINDYGGPVVWGWFLIAIAVVLVAAGLLSTTAMYWALITGAFVYMLFALFFGAAALADNQASFFGAVMAGRAAIMHLSRATAYREGPSGQSADRSLG